MPTGRCPACGHRKQIFGTACADCLAKGAQPRGNSPQRARFGNAPAHVSSWEGKIAGPAFRLQWNRNTWLLEELPKKGKRRLRVATMNNPGGQYAGHRGMDPFIEDNILRVARVSPSESYDHVKAAISKAMAEAAKEVVLKKRAAGDTKWDFLLRGGFDWSERDVYFPEVMPEGLEPFKADGKDFVISVDWKNFSAYSPNSDFQRHDPHYSLYESSSPASARKLYQLLRKEPNALRGVSWASLGPWLNERKINYETRHSSW